MPNLLSIERLCLFGLIFTGFCKKGKVPKVDEQDRDDKGRVLGSVHPDNEVRNMLKGDLDLYLARIYAISYEGGYQLLPRPTVFLVHGEGADPEDLDQDPGGPVQITSGWRPRPTLCSPV